MANYFINADIGNDTTGDGSACSPWLTFVKALNDPGVTDGDVIVAQDSVNTYDFPNGVQVNKNITLEGLSDDASGAVFSQPASIASWTIRGDDKVVTFSKITFRGIRSSNNYSGTGTPLIFVWGARIVFLIDRCVFEDIETTCSFSVGGLISGQNSNTSPNALVTIQNCIISNVIEHLAAAPSITQSGMFCNRQSVGMTMVVQDNSILIPTNSGFVEVFSFNQAGSSLIDRGNLIKAAGGNVKHSHLHPSVTHTSYENNHNGLTDLPASVTSDATNITDDPLWVDEDNNNFNLAPGSTGIDSRSIE